MNLVTAILEIEQEGEMLILKPAIELHDLDELKIEGAAHELLEHIETSGVADVFLDLPSRQSLHGALFEREVDERVLVFDDGGTRKVKFSFQFFVPDFRIFPHEGAEQPDD